MRRFLFRTVLLALPIIAVLAVMEIVLRRIPNDYSLKAGTLTAHGDSIGILVLGGSHSYHGIEPALLPDHAFNAANISQDLRYDRALLEQYIDHLPALQCIVVQVSYGSFGAELEHGKEAWRVKNYVLYMDMGDKATQLAHHLELLNRPMSEQWTMIRDFLAHGKDNRLCAANGARMKPAPDGLDLEGSGREAAKRHTRTSSASIERSKAELARIVEMATARRVHVLLYTPPAWSSYRASVDSAQLASVVATCNSYVRSDTLVRYRNLFADERFIEADYSDADHLSPSGAEKMSRILAADLATFEPAKARSRP
jgi:hypothetical protein